MVQKNPPELCACDHEKCRREQFSDLRKTLVREDFLDIKFYSSNSAVTINPRGVCSIFFTIPLRDLIRWALG